ncbi:MAG: oxidoreductase [Gemmatimonadota bacterium]|nr:oxidoreductase [Gemmatimonadota bacterium]
MKRHRRWTAADIPDQTGRVAIVTGANAGLGLENARVLGRKGCRVVLACRDEGRATAARERLESETGWAEFDTMRLDLASLASVDEFASRFREGYERLDLLVNNAGVMFPPFDRTGDGFELQFGVNYLGHFALTGLLLGTLERTPGARVVTLASMAHRGARIDFESFTGETPYRRFRAYRQSKLACLMFALELDRRLRAADSRTLSVAAHPGGTATDLQRHNELMRVGARVVAMPVEQGALSQLRAQTDPEVKGGAYIGPDGAFEFRGYPAPAQVDPAARDAATRERLWTESETLTGVRYP